MKSYKLYEQDLMGYESNTIYLKSYNKAIQWFNNEVKNAVAEAGEDIVNKSGFSEQISSFRSWSKNEEIISRRYPYLLYKKDNRLIVQVFYWQNTSHEHSEYEILDLTIILEEIDIVE